MNDNRKFAHIRELYLPYKFELLLRGSRDGFTPKTFHKLCDNKHNTIIFIKVKGTEEILGGYNPIIWSSSKIWDTWGKTVRDGHSVLRSLIGPDRSLGNF